MVTRRVCHILLATIVTASLLSGSRGVADDANAHPHKPIVVRSRPVIERLPLRVIQPVDVALTEIGETVVADEIGQMVFRVDAAGETSLLAENLKGLSRVADSRSLGIHVLIAASRSGRIIRLTDNGFESDVAEFSFAPTGLGVDSVGNLWTTDAARREVVLTDTEGIQTTVARLSETPVDLTADGLGAVVLLSSGKVVAVGAGGGSTKLVGYVAPGSTRLRMMADGAVIALAVDDRGRSVLLRPTADREAVERFAAIPAGTSSFAFDKLGNLTLANPDLRAVTRVTSHYTIPCPHCGVSVPMVLSPDAPAPEQQQRRRSF